MRTLTLSLVALLALCGCGTTPAGHETPVGEGRATTPEPRPDRPAGDARTKIPMH